MRQSLYFVKFLVLYTYMYNNCQEQIQFKANTLYFMTIFMYKPYVFFDADYDSAIRTWYTRVNDNLQNYPIWLVKRTSRLYCIVVSTAYASGRIFECGDSRVLIIVNRLILCTYTLLFIVCIFF